MKLLELVLIAIALLPAKANPQITRAESRSLYKASLHAFSLVRSGVDIDDAATGIQHRASHLDDATPPGDGIQRSLVGGWYNAADYGKWTMMVSISVGYMLHAYAAQQQSGRPDSQLANEAQWGLAWLLKMQDADGGVRHKVDSVTPSALGQAWGLPPELDPTIRVASGASTLDTADFAAVMYQASRTFAPIDPSASKRFRLAAQKAYSWLVMHPRVSVRDPFYPDNDPAQEVFWARCERAVSGESSDGLAAALQHTAAVEVSWSNPSLLGLYGVASSRNVSPKLRSAASEAIERSASAQAAASESRQFHVALAPDEYAWGSAEKVLHRAALFVMADRLRPSGIFHAATMHQLGWVLGNNAARHSFIVGFGTHPVQHPYHWSYMVYGKLIPGWTAGGPNGSPEGADPALLALQRAGTPPDRCYVDMCSRNGSWASNEGQISEQAALLIVTSSAALHRPE